MMIVQETAFAQQEVVLSDRIKKLQDNLDRVMAERNIDASTKSEQEVTNRRLMIELRDLRKSYADQTDALQV